MSGVSTEDGRRRDQETRDQRTNRAATTAVVGNAQMADNCQKGGCEMKTVKKATTLGPSSASWRRRAFHEAREAVYPH